VSLVADTMLRDLPPPEYLLYHTVCLVLSCLVLSCLVLSGLVWSGLVWSGLVLSCLVLSCLLLQNIPRLTHSGDVHTMTLDFAKQV
jgi:hypothetical protein